MRTRLFISCAAGALISAAPALAQTEVNDERTSPIRTSTINNGQPNDILITTNGRVRLTGDAGPAVTMDSTHNVENRGTISVTGADGGVAVHMVGGASGTFTNVGAVTLGSGEDDDTRYTDLVGILIDGDGAFTGDIRNLAGGAIRVDGDDSAGIRAILLLDGSIENLGLISVTGSNGVGIDLRQGLTGDLNLGGAVNAAGEGSTAVRLGGDVGGILAIRGNIFASGYTVSDRPTGAGATQVNMDEQLQGGPAIIVGGDLAHGFFVVGPTADDRSINQGAITVLGSAPAIWISPEFRTTGAGDIFIGRVFFAADPDDEDSEDELLDYGLVNRGAISANGIFDGVSATAIRIEGAWIDGDLFTTTIEGGIRNNGSFSANAFAATATTLLIGEGAIIPFFHNDNEFFSTVSNGGTARGLVILEGGSLPHVMNSSLILARVQGAGSAIAILDESNTLSLIENSGLILAQFAGVNGQPIAADLPEQAFARAIDLSRSTIDVTFRQTAPEDAPVGFEPGVTGDIVLGSGDDTVDVSAGFIRGDIDFGTGADRLLISGTGHVHAALRTADNDLAIEMDGGSLEILNRSTANIRTANFGDGSRLIFRVDTAEPGVPLLDASETITFESGSRVSASLSNLIGMGAEYIVLHANELVIEDTLLDLVGVDSPFLYSVVLERHVDDNETLVMTLQRRSASEMGMNDAQSAAFEAAWSTWLENSALGAAFAGLSSASSFYAAYNQLLPEYSVSAIQFAIANNDSAMGAISNRLDAARRSPDGTGGIWVQEFGYFADRAGSAFGPGYRGQGFGMAMGVDRPFGPFYAVGLNLSGAASEIAEHDGFDKPMTALTAQFGGYAGLEMGGFTADFYAGLGLDRFETERRILIGAFDRTAAASWTGHHMTASARFGRDFEFGRRYYVRPAVSVDFLRLNESSYTETGGGLGVDLTVDRRDTQTFSSTASITFGARFGDPTSWWSPQLRLGYRNEFDGVSTETTARFAGTDSPFNLRAHRLPGTGAVFGFSLSAGSGYSTFSFDYDADFRDDFVRHIARVVVRLVF
ncbi:MAG: autotransporter outer membrane beta-barrel domain-containing protein [Maricaulaceae bacterium]|nr:autotransporter outer membrane beta-barrel domain-containing protein [Maricaulaceae bacterium]